MEHVVFFPAADGAPAFRRVASLDEAVRLVEHLRNDQGVSSVSVHALSEVPLAFRAYYKVEVPEAAPCRCSSSPTPPRPSRSSSPSPRTGPEPVPRPPPSPSRSPSPRTPTPRSPWPELVTSGAPQPAPASLGFFA